MYKNHSNNSKWGVSMRKKTNQDSVTTAKLPLKLIDYGNYEAFEAKDSGFLLGYVKKGEGLVALGEEKIAVSEGKGIFMTPAVLKTAEISKESADFEMNWVIFKGSCAKDILGSCGFKDSFVFDINSHSTLDTLMDKIARAKSTRSLKVALQMESVHLYGFILEIGRLLAYASSGNQEILKEQLKPVFDYIGKNFTRDIELEQLAKEVDLSPQYICRIFKKCTNMRPFEYITKMRIEEAKKLVVKGGLSVNEIARAVGYSDCSYFCAVFKREVGISPMKYKANQQG